MIIYVLVNVFLHLLLPSLQRCWKVLTDSSQMMMMHSGSTVHVRWFQTSQHKAETVWDFFMTNQTQSEPYAVVQVSSVQSTSQKTQSWCNYSVVVGIENGKWADALLFLSYWKQTGRCIDCFFMQIQFPHMRK